MGLMEATTGTVISKATGKRRIIKVRPVGSNFGWVGSVHAGGYQLGETEIYSYPYAALNQARELAHTL